MKYIIAALLLVGCGSKDDSGLQCCAPPRPLTAEEHQAQYEKSIELTLMLDKDGCKVYRFLDRKGDGYHHYYTTCEGSVDSTIRYRSGKSTRTRPDSTPTTVEPLK